MVFFCINHYTKFGYPPEYACKEFGINTLSARNARIYSAPPCANPPGAG